MAPHGHLLLLLPRSGVLPQPLHLPDESVRFHPSIRTIAVHAFTPVLQQRPDFNEGAREQMKKWSSALGTTNTNATNAITFDNLGQ